MFSKVLNTPETNFIWKGFNSCFEPIFRIWIWSNHSNVFAVSTILWAFKTVLHLFIIYCVTIKVMISLTVSGISVNHENMASDNSTLVIKLKSQETCFLDIASTY